MVAFSGRYSARPGVFGVVKSESVHIRGWPGVEISHAMLSPRIRSGCSKPIASAPTVRYDCRSELVNIATRQTRSLFMRVDEKSADQNHPE
jgi:hypothetical protein